MQYKFFMIVFLLIAFGCDKKTGEIKPEKTAVKNQQKIIDTYLKGGAWNYHYLEKEWDEWIAKGIAKDSTIALLWQQRAIPFWKTKKYSIALNYYDKAVALAPQDWLSRRSFLKCIFAKDYKGAIVDAENCISKYGTTHEQDHLLEFYIGVAHLQLGQYEKALGVLSEMIKKEEEEQGANWVHYLDRFYLAMCHYELGNYEKAITEIDKVLAEYSSFSDAFYYKGLCFKYLGDKGEAKRYLDEGLVNYVKGYTFNEDSNKYEDYPYQVTWQWQVLEGILND